MRIIRNVYYRRVILTLGFVSVSLGFIGIFLPLLPTTPFAILAAWCFLRSSRKAHVWLYRQPYFGKALQDWDQHKSISRRSKVIAIISIVISQIVMWTQVPWLGLKIGVTIFLIFVSIYIMTRSERTGSLN